jgi:hypothetical protein
MKTATWFCLVVGVVLSVAAQQSSAWVNWDCIGVVSCTGGWSGDCEFNGFNNPISLCRNVSYTTPFCDSQGHLYWCQGTDWRTQTTCQVSYWGCTP